MLRDSERESIDKRTSKRENKNYIASVTGVVHLDCNQGAPLYLYKNVEVCMKARRLLESAWKLLESA